MAESLSDQTWNILLDRIKKGTCLPFLGAGAGYPYLPLGGDVARKLAEKYGYPFEDKSDLIKVAQYVAVSVDALSPKEDLLAMLQGAQTPPFNDPGQPHGVLAELPI